ncbi:hypothetical protein PRIPAC_81056 [Pristionchus pacificus]|uniref:Uncharacterized protein n=1 Tax=Pristionchus pacificus TaxID=54126 RepID=A0A2A6CK53_PRIPA|nr:hypothetical protein PRIPAC_81056 [Pristionchus pacificus]|eukprot:PDM78480.1 hypothetical protein PRIPAC_31059 [Pristionchus pacificus]
MSIKSKNSDDMSHSLWSDYWASNKARFPKSVTALTFENRLWCSNGAFSAGQIFTALWSDDKQRLVAISRTMDGVMN